MELLIQTKRFMWNISSRGIRKVKIWDWKQAKETFERLFIEQEKSLKEAITGQGPVIKAIDQAVKEGKISAPKNNSAWRRLEDNKLP